MRLASSIGAVAVSLVVLAAPAVAGMGFEDNKLNFQSCDGQKLTARWRENNFHLSVPGQTLEPAAPELKYLGWDGKCRHMSVNDKGQFEHTLGDTSQADRLINYLSWDGTKWSATRAGTGFFKVFVADKDEASPDKHMMEAAVWLKKHKPKSRAASTLARELVQASEK